jgi:sodium-dependent dicarboxylate transporter 2/3/5
MTAYAASAGGIGTPIGTPPNLIGIAIIEKSIGVKIHFFQWMVIAVPCLIVMYVVLFLLMYRLEKPEVGTIEGARDYVRGELAKLRPWTPGEKNTLGVFGLAVTLWVLPGFLAFIYGATSEELKGFNSRMPEAAVAIVCAALLFLLPVDWPKRTFTLTWTEASRIDWGTLLLFGGGISLGNLMFGTGLAEAIGKGLLALTGASSVAGITFAAIAVAILVSEATSNTASANMIVPVMISLTMAAGLNPIAPAIGATLAASWGFMLPVSTPPNAIVYGSGLVPITRMIRAGFLFDLVGAVTIWATVMLLLPLVGLG